MSDVRDTEPRLLKEPRGGVPDVTSTLDGYHRVCDAMAEATGSLAADAERASGFRYGHEDWLIQFKREGAGIALLDPVALTRAAYLPAESRSVWGRLFGGSPRNFVAALAETDTLTDADIDELAEYLEELKKERK